MEILASLISSVLVLIGLSSVVVVVDASGWRAECSYGGSAQFNIINGIPYLSTMCPDNENNQICSVLDLNYCFMNSAGHMKGTINGGFLRSCTHCHLGGKNATILMCSCRRFGKDAPYQDTQVDLEVLIENRNGRLGCFDSKPLTCDDM